MPDTSDSLLSIYKGWDGYQSSLMHAVTPLTAAQLAFRPAPHLRSVGELVRHIALGRVDWFLRMDAPGSRQLAGQISVWDEDQQGNRYAREQAIVAVDNAGELAKWLEASWQMIDQTLRLWTVDDLQKTYRHTWRGETYAISRQWTIWRIMAHDLHHGGELSLLLGIQGIENLELGALGGHIIEPPRVEDKNEPSSG
jgi:uncharacterized damage-inducible protein DinB